MHGVGHETNVWKTTRLDRGPAPWAPWPEWSDYPHAERGSSEKGRMLGAAAMTAAGGVIGGFLGLTTAHGSVRGSFPIAITVGALAGAAAMGSFALLANKNPNKYEIDDQIGVASTGQFAHDIMVTFDHDGSVSLEMDPPDNGLQRHDERLATTTYGSASPGWSPFGDVPKRTRKNWPDHAPWSAAKLFKAADANRDRSVNAGELQAYVDRVADANGDGRMSSGERHRFRIAHLEQ